MNVTVHPFPFIRLCNKSALPITVLGMAFLSGCKPDGAVQPAAPAAPATSVPVPEEQKTSSSSDKILQTLHLKSFVEEQKALAATEQFQQATARAVKLHPELGVAGSPMNQLFLARVKELKTKDGRYFEDKEWPTKLADEIHRARTSSITSYVHSITVAQQPALYVGRWVPISGILTEARSDRTLWDQGVIKLVLEGDIVCEVSRDSLLRINGADPSRSGDGSTEFRTEQKSKTLVIQKRIKGARGLFQPWTELAVLEQGRRVTVTGQLEIAAGKLVLRSAAF